MLNKHNINLMIGFYEVIDEDTLIKLIHFKILLNNILDFFNFCQKTLLEQNERNTRK